MGREQAMAETFGRTEDQAHREEQGAGGSTETNQSSQRDTSTVRKLSWHVHKPSSKLTVREVPLHIILVGSQVTLHGGFNLVGMEAPPSPATF